MPWYEYPPLLAVDRNLDIARDATGQFYDVADTTFATPLNVQDMAGADIPGDALTTSFYGLTNWYRLDRKVAVWKSGTFTHLVWSIAGMIDDLEAAQTQATNAALAAQNAAALVDAPADVTVATLVGNTATQTHGAVKAIAEQFGGGGTGGGGSPYGIFAIQRNAGNTDWEFANYAAAQAAGLLATMTPMFIGPVPSGTPVTPAWISVHPRKYLYTETG